MTDRGTFHGADFRRISLAHFGPAPRSNAKLVQQEPRDSIIATDHELDSSFFLLDEVKHQQLKQV
jgi:hypothetical protein